MLFRSKKISRSNTKFSSGKVLEYKRFREKIRSYIGTSEYKERDSSLEAAKVKIEDYMETYKAWEKEAKMKAFSKESLASGKPDKKAEEKEKIKEWLNDGLKRLNEIQSSYETELENLGNRPRKAKRGKYEQKLDAQKSKLEYVKQQITRVELLIKSLNHETIPIEAFNSIKDSFQSYLGEPNSSQTRASWDAVNKYLP